MRLSCVNRISGKDLQFAGAVVPPNGRQTAPKVGEFLEIHERLNGRLIRYAERFASRDDAFDAVGDVWLSIWCHWPSLPHKKRNDRYFFGAVHKRVARIRRKQRKMVSLDDADVELDRRAMSAASDKAQQDALAEFLEESIAAMTPRRRAVLLAVDKEQSSHAGAGEELGLSVDTIRTHLRLARDDLRAAFKRAGFFSRRVGGSPRAPRCPARGNRQSVAA